MSSYQYRKSHCGDKTVVRSSYLHNGISYTSKMTSSYWIRDLLVLPPKSITVTSKWACWRPKSPASQLFTQLFIQAQMKENMKALAFVQGIHWWLVNSPHKWPVTRKMSPFDDVILLTRPHWVRTTGSRTKKLWYYHQHCQLFFTLSLWQT